jgi:hypothetical protein
MHKAARIAWIARRIGLNEYVAALMAGEKSTSVLIDAVL